MYKIEPLEHPPLKFHTIGSVDLPSYSSLILLAISCTTRLKLSYGVKIPAHLRSRTDCSILCVEIDVEAICGLRSQHNLSCVFRLCGYRRCPSFNCGARFLVKVVAELLSRSNCRITSRDCINWIGIILCNHSEDCDYYRPFGRPIAAGSTRNSNASVPVTSGEKLCMSPSASQHSSSSPLPVDQVHTSHEHLIRRFSNREIAAQTRKALSQQFCKCASQKKRLDHCHASTCRLLHCCTSAALLIRSFMQFYFPQVVGKLE